MVALVWHAMEKGGLGPLGVCSRRWADRAPSGEDFNEGTRTIALGTCTTFIARDGHAVFVLFDKARGSNSATAVDGLETMLFAVESDLDQTGEFLIGLVAVRVGDRVGEGSERLSVDPQLPLFGLRVLGGVEMVVAKGVVVATGSEQHGCSGEEGKQAESHGHCKRFWARQAWRSC